MTRQEALREARKAWGPDTTIFTRWNIWTGLDGESVVYHPRAGVLGAGEDDADALEDAEHSFMERCRDAAAFADADRRAAPK